jgi:BASS family bile acid:Na+ symporter
VKIVRFVSSNIVLWVILFAILAFFYPAVFLIFKHSINWFFAGAMFGIGLVLKSEDYRNIVKSPLAVLFGTLCQFTIMPLLSLGIGLALKLPDYVILGMVITGAAPGAMTSNVISFLSKADVAYSVSLTTVATFLAPVLTPLLTLWLVGQRIPVSFWAMFNTIVITVVVPLLAGFGVRKLFPAFIEKVEDVPPLISVLSIVVITSYVVAANVENLRSTTLIILVAVFLVNLFGMVLGFLAGYIPRFNLKRRKTLAIEIGMQNAGLGVVLALKHFDETVAMPAAFYTIWCIISATVFVRIVNSFRTSGVALK